MVVGGDVVVVDDEEGVGAIDAFSGGVQVGADTLEETAQLVCV